MTLAAFVAAAEAPTIRAGIPLTVSSEYNVLMPWTDPLATTPPPDQRQPAQGQQGQRRRLRNERSYLRVAQRPIVKPKFVQGPAKIPIRPIELG